MYHFASNLLFNKQVDLLNNNNNKNKNILADNADDGTKKNIFKL